jgi:UDP-N-acetylglucosamine 2-epimerase (non-hydrolysing)
MKVAIIVGTRPEIIKMAPVMRAALARKGVTPLLWHTGQHYSFEMDRQMFDDLALPKPDQNIEVGSGSHAVQTATIMTRLEKLMQTEKPDAVLVQGDTNTVLGASLVATKLHIPLGHIEAGLRSYDRSMPEEINRIACDHIADVLYPPTKNAQAILEHEAIPTEQIVMTGNTVVDAVHQNVELAKQKSQILSQFSGSPYVFLTLHRAENVDHLHKISGVISALKQLLHSNKELEILWSLHPRTRKQLEAFNLLEEVQSMDRLHLLQPPGYLDALLLQSHAQVIMTDSGGIQEEACILGTPCVTLRENTERPESVEVGANELVGTDTGHIVTAITKHLGQKAAPSWQNPFGDGKAGERIIADLLTRFGNGSPLKAPALWYTARYSAKKDS